MKPIIDIVQIFVADDRLFNAVIDLPEKANFIGAVTALMGSGHMDTIRSKFTLLCCDSNVESLIV